MKTAKYKGDVRQIVMVLLAALVLTCAAHAKYSGGSGTPGNPYRIATPEDLDLLGTATEDYDAYFALTANIDLSGRTFTSALIASGKAFTGVFDGGRHAIFALTIDTGGGSHDDLGLFGHLDRGGHVKDLGLENATVIGRDELRYVGALVGYNEGRITNCYVTATVAGGEDSCCLGGLVGRNWSGTVSNCYAGGSVTGGEGKTTTEMQTASTFLAAGWDFMDETDNGIDDIWWILEGQDYPRLWWEATSDDVTDLSE